MLRWLPFWSVFEESDFARSIPLGNLYRPRGFCLEDLSAGSLSGRVVVITGANKGLGFESAAAFALAGATTVLACRDEAKAAAAAADIRLRVPAAKLEIIVLDLGSRASVRRAAAEITQRFSSLHILVNNGGVPAGPAPLQYADGVEACFQINHLGHFELTLLLLPLLKASAAASAPSRIVHVASSAHRFAPTHREWIDLEFLNDPSKHSMVERYGMAKLAQLAFSTELARRLNASGEAAVLSNAVHPGIVATEIVTANAVRLFGDVLGALVKGVMAVRNAVMAYSVADGALTQLFAAVSPTVTSGGGYFVPIAQPWRTGHALAEDAAFGKALWTFSEEALRRPDGTSGSCEQADS